MQSLGERQTCKIRARKILGCNGEKYVKLKIKQKVGQTRPQLQWFGIGWK